MGDWGLIFIFSEGVHSLYFMFPLIFGCFCFAVQTQMQIQMSLPRNSSRHAQQVHQIFVRLALFSKTRNRHTARASNETYALRNRGIAFSRAFALHGGTRESFHCGICQHFSHWKRSFMSHELRPHITQTERLHSSHVQSGRQSRSNPQLSQDAFVDALSNGGAFHLSSVGLQRITSAQCSSACRIL